MPDSDDQSNSSRSSPPNLPEDLAERLSQLDASELRAVISYSRSLLPRPPTVEDLLEERPGEEILDVTEEAGYTKVVKTQPCAEGCDECPHGPYLYHVRVEQRPGRGNRPSTGTSSVLCINMETEYSVVRVRDQFPPTISAVHSFIDGNAQTGLTKT